MYIAFPTGPLCILSYLKKYIPETHVQILDLNIELRLLTENPKSNISISYNEFLDIAFSSVHEVKYPRQSRGLEFVNRSKRFLLFVISSCFFQPLVICPFALPCLA
jgi:hypothetical protein